MAKKTAEALAGVGTVPTLDAATLAAIAQAVVAAMQAQQPQTATQSAPVAPQTPNQKARAMLAPFCKLDDKGKVAGLRYPEPVISVDGAVVKPRGTPKRLHAHIELVEGALVSGKTVTVTARKA